MRIARSWTFVTTLLAVACAGQSVPPSNSTWISTLQTGGYVILLRHAATDWRASDSDPTHLDVCANQRNLDERGRAQAAAIGNAFRALNIPVGKVETSEYCRCIETARLAFGSGTTSVDLTSINHVDPPEALRRITAIRGRIASRPAPGSNTVLVSHMAMIIEATGVALEEGEAAIFKPLDNGSAQLAGTITADEWVRESQNAGARAAKH